MDLLCSKSNRRKNRGPIRSSAGDRDCSGASRHAVDSRKWLNPRRNHECYQGLGWIAGGALCALAGTTHALWLDTRTLDRQLVPLPGSSEILVLHSGIERELASSGYNARRAECEQAAEMLGLVSLRDVVDPVVARLLPEPLCRRVRHVLTENARVLQAVAADAQQLGNLMNASHASMRDDYEVSHPQLDRLVALLQSHPDVYGARLTGGGFGGACVALCNAGTSNAVARQVLAEYRSDNPRARLLVPWAQSA